ncbi:MAG: EscU/YscU/HrcU family type III secretion system export apparatus switch protein [Oscillospiraceae bacterium]
MSKSKSKKAVALKYNIDKDMAPVVIASGYGEIAERIIDIAEQKGIPVFRDDSAASLMCMLDVGSNIPSELYEVIAAIYGQIMKTSADIKNKTTLVSDLDSLSDRHSNFSRKRSALGQEVPELIQIQTNSDDDFKE